MRILGYRRASPEEESRRDAATLIRKPALSWTKLSNISERSRPFYRLGAPSVADSNRVRDRWCTNCYTRGLLRSDYFSFHAGERIRERKRKRVVDWLEWGSSCAACFTIKGRVVCSGFGQRMVDCYGAADIDLNVFLSFFFSFWKEMFIGK